MMPVGEVPIGTLVFLNCGCSGVRVGRPDGPVVVVVERPCQEHSSAGQVFTKSLDRWEMVSPLTQARGSSER
jgi:hypothetical protein